MCSSDVLIKLIDFWTHPEHFVNTFWTCSVFYIFAHVLLNVLICSKQNTSAILVFWICSRSVLWTAYVFRTCSNDVLMKLIALWTHHEHILNMFWTRSEHVICSALFAVYTYTYMHTLTLAGVNPHRRIRCSNIPLLLFKPGGWKVNTYWLTSHNWQTWKSRFLTCHCHEI